MLEAIFAVLVALCCQAATPETPVTTPEVTPAVVEAPDPWSLWLADSVPTDNGYMPETLYNAINDAVEFTGVDGAALCATLFAESRLCHYRNKKVIRGDHGKAIGMAQIHRSPWQKYYSFNPEFGEKRKVDLDELYDNVMVCALILKRGGYDATDQKAQQHAFGYYNTGHECVTRYSLAVNRLANEIRSYKPEEATE
jgi:hypothetical protein